MNCDLLFNVDPEHTIVTEAVIAFEKPVIAEWPLADLNEALAQAYSASFDPPWVEAWSDHYSVRQREDEWNVADSMREPLLPQKPVNDAIAAMLSQPDWPDSMAVYLYPVRKPGDPTLHGLWLADSIDFADDDPDLEAVAFRAVRDAAEKHRKQFPDFVPRRYS